MHHAQKGLIITTARFTGQAKTEAEQLGVVLVDGTTLAKLMIEYDVGVTPKETYTVKVIDTDFFEG